jgi:GDPmannose 4,6-dehydratase
VSKQACALVTGASGQDAKFLAEHLLAQGYDVHGIIRRQSVSENQNSRVKHLEGVFKLHYGDVTDAYSLDRIFREVMPDRIFHTAAMSHVRVSFDVKEYTIQTNGIGTLNMLEVYRRVCPEARFLTCCSSEQFGTAIDADGYQRETTPMWPTSPYGCSKVLAFNLTRHWRAAYKLFATTTICFNHSSPFRGANFLTKKVVKEAVEIKLGKRPGMALGDLSPWRDFGHSSDYTRAMIMALDHTEPDDFVIATGVSHQIKDVVEYVFAKLGLDWEQYVTHDARLLRAQELPRLRGDASKARRVLGWAPTYTFETLLDEMIEHELVLQQSTGG